MAWTDTVHKFLGHGKYNATLPTYSDGQTAEAQCDSRGRVLVTLASDASAPPTSTSAGTTWGKTTGLTATHRELITATDSKGLLYLRLRSTYASAGYIQLHDLNAVADLVSATSVPIGPSFDIASNGTVEIEYPRARMFTSGIVWAFSTTPNVYTQDASATVVAEWEIF